MSQATLGWVVSLLKLVREGLWRRGREGRDRGKKIRLMVGEGYKKRWVGGGQEAGEGGKREGRLEGEGGRYGISGIWRGRCRRKGGGGRGVAN
jgi:hypothetical protein